MDKVCIYLRKSRADEEAEKRGEGETLSKHRKILMKTAKKLSLNIIKIREEIVSGESLIHRPEMLELLKEVEQKKYDAILVMDIDRLGRGNMQEQGLILDTFKKSKTKIITPRKTYDLQDEFDEEYSEFEAFMARKELKIINRRLQRGRIRSIEDGNYISPLPPYGYTIHETKDSRTLKPHPEQSSVVKMIFDLYVNNNMGGSKIANKLNQLGYKTFTGKDWSSHSVLHTLKNEVYTGKVIWKKKEIKKSKDPEKIKDTKTRPKDEWIVADGKHEGLITDETFRKTMNILNKKTHVPYNTKITNPLSGLIKCEECGSSMVYRPYTQNRDPHIMCYRRCNNKSSKFKYVEQKLLDGLQEWLISYKAKWENMDFGNEPNYNKIKVLEKGLSNLKKELSETENQKNKLHDLLERGVYDVDTYLERSKVIADILETLQSNIIKVEDELINTKERLNAQQEIVPQVEHVLELYPKTENAAKKNKLLKTVLEKAVYKKEKHQRNDEFSLTLYPKLPSACR